jgi:Zn-dependent protease
MGRIRLGSIFGIDIRIDPSWFVIVFLILFSVTFDIFPATFRGLSIATYILMGLAGTVLFFVSLLIHELTHSLMARRHGIQVPAITLFIFGGMSHLGREAKSPAEEFQIAIVGPLASFALSALFGVIWWLGQRAGLPVPVTGTSRYLAGVNFALAVFNLLPGFPLDGGRVLRAAVWKATGDVTRATRAAATGGKWFGYGLMALGALQFIAGNGMGGIWLVLIGWFLRNAAQASYAMHLRLARRDREGDEGPSQQQRAA